MPRLLILLSLLLPALAHAEPLRVFVSVLPLQGLVEQIGGEQVQADSMVLPGHSPATYNPSPRQIAALADTRLFFRVGVPFEDAWMARIRAVNPTMRVIDLRQGIALRELEQHRHGHSEHEHEDEHADADHDAVHSDGKDPHIWTDPLLTRQLIGTIRDALAQALPAQRALFDARHHELDQRLLQLHQRIDTLLHPYHGSRFLVFHPAWGYFAERYQLQQIAIEHEGKPIGPKSLDHLIEQAREQQARVVFVQPQFDTRLAARIAKAIDGKVVAIDPLAVDYFYNLLHTAQQIAEALPHD